jgi:hypothetical protein
MVNINIGGASLVIVVLWASLGLMSLLVSHDPFSPNKFYMAQLPIFFGGVVDGNWNTYTYLVCAILIISGVVQMVWESRTGVAHSIERVGFNKISKKISCSASDFGLGRVHLIVWLLSLIPLLIQFWVVYMSGGFMSFIGNLGGRVEWMSGMGPLLILLRMLPVINMCYLGILLSRRTIGLWSATFGILHTLLCVGNGLLVGSRSSSMFPLVFAVIAYHYCRKRFSIFTLACLCFGFTISAAYLGAVRETLKVDSGEIILAKAEGASDYRWSNFVYGLMGVDVVSEAGVVHPQYGMTYLTAFTNFIPRKIWPGKPDTGGVIFTKEYLGDMWGGASYATPGIFGEAMMNFGLNFGLLIGVCILLVCFMFNCTLYRNVVRGYASGSRSDLWFFVVLYFCGLQFTNGLLVGEFSNITIGFMINVFFVWVSLRCLSFAVVKKPQI